MSEGKENGLDKDDVERASCDVLPVENNYDNWVGKTVFVSSANFTGTVNSQKVIKRDHLTSNNSNDTMLLLYFEDSHYVCNADVVVEVKND